MSRLISREEVLLRTTFSQPTLWRLERAGEFPKAIKLSDHRVAYDEAEIDEWIQQKKLASQGGEDQTQVATMRNGQEKHAVGS